MRIERSGRRHVGSECGKYSDRRDASRAGSGIAIFGAYRDSVARQANEAEPLGSLLRHNHALAATNEICIEKACPRDKARIAHSGESNALKQRPIALGHEWIVRSGPATRPFSRHAKWDRRCRNCTAINSEGSCMQVNAQQLANHGAQLALHGVIKAVIPDGIKSTCLGQEQE